MLILQIFLEMAISLLVTLIDECSCQIAFIRFIGHSHLVCFIQGVKVIIWKLLSTDDIMNCYIPQVSIVCQMQYPPDS